MERRDKDRLLRARNGSTDHMKKFVYFVKLSLSVQYRLTVNALTIHVLVQYFQVHKSKIHEKQRVEGAYF